MKKSEQKKNGVYYSPDLVVEYMLKKTIGVWVEKLNSRLSVIYDQKNEFYWRDFILEIKSLSILDPACGEGIFLLKTYHFLENIYRQIPSQYLDFQIEKQITQHIFGVDIDQKALDRFQEMIFAKSGFYCPNIRCGNSLISDPKLTSIFFDWQVEFPFGKFDIIVGNPPYGAELSQEEQKYFAKKFPIGNTDTAALFIIQARNLLKDKGLNAFIIPKSFTYASNWAKTRQEILADVIEIVDCGKVWKEVNLEMSIYNSQKNVPTTTYLSSVRQDTDFLEISEIDKNLADKFGFIVNGVSKEEITIALKIKSLPKVLNNFVSNQRGAGLQKLVDNQGDSYVLGGKNIGRYEFATNLKNKVKSALVKDSKALIKNNSILVQNIVSFVNKPKPLLQIRACLPLKRNFFVLDTINQLENKSEYDVKFILGILNSKLVSWYLYHFVFAHAKMTMHFDSPITQKIPFPNLDLNNPNQKEKHNLIVEKVENLLKYYEQKNNFINKIFEIEQELNQLVFELYGLNEEEINLIK